MKKNLCALFLLLALAGTAGAATVEKSDLVWYRIHLGMGVGDMAVAPQKMRDFVDAVITPAFPEGLTITESRGQWRSPEHGLIRERTTVIDVQCPDTDDNSAAIERIAEEYAARFKAAKASVFVVRTAPVSTTLYY